MKLLVIRFSSIGDIVLTTPVLRCLKQQRKDISIHYLTKLSYKDVVVANPYIDKVHYLEDDINAVIENLKGEQFDEIIDLHNNLRTMRIKRALKIRSYSFSKLNIQKWLLVNLKINLMPDKSIVERYLETVKHLDVYNDGKGLDYFIPDNVKLEDNDIPMSHWAGFVGCVIGGSYNTKKLPVDKWKDICLQSPYPVILLGGPEDREFGDQIAANDKLKIYNSCGKFSLNESARLVQLAKVVVSNDTGLMHIAAAFNKTIVSFWGNTSPEMGMFPYFGYNNVSNRKTNKSIVIENKKLYCHPCSKIGYNRCPEGHFRCMNDLDITKLPVYIADIWNVNR